MTSKQTTSGAAAFGTLPDTAADHEFIGCYAYLVRDNPLWRANLDGYDRHGERLHAAPVEIPPMSRDSHSRPIMQCTA